MECVRKSIGYVLYGIGSILIILPMCAVIVLIAIMMIPIVLMIPGSVLGLVGARIAGIDLKKHDDEENGSNGEV